ncbi:S-adenosylmethionine transporter [Thecaphora frezii]
MYLPRRTSFSPEQRPKLGRNLSSSSVVSLHVHQSYLASKVGQLSCKHGLGLASSDAANHAGGANSTPFPTSTIFSSPTVQLDGSTASSIDHPAQRSTATANEPARAAGKSSRLDNLFVGSRNAADNSKPSAARGTKNVSLREYAETRWKDQELLESRIMQSSDVRRLEWEAKAAMLRDAYPLAILLLYRAGMLGSASSCISLARLYALGITKGSAPVVVLVYRDPLRSLAWSLEALAILERRLSAQIKAASASGAVTRRLRELWEAPLEAVTLLLRAIISPEVAALSPNQRNAVALPDISKLAGSQSAGRDASGNLAEGIKEDLWIRAEDAVSRLAARLPASDADVKAQISVHDATLGPDDEEDDEALQRELESLRTHVRYLEAVLKSRSFVLDPRAELIEGLREAWSCCTSLDPHRRGIEAELQAYAAKAKGCLDGGLSSGDVDSTEGRLFQPLILSLDQLLPELAVPDLVTRNRQTHAVRASSEAHTETKNKRVRRNSLKKVEPEDIETTAKHEASARPVLTMRLASTPAAASASVASVFASGQTQEPSAFSQSADSRQRLTRTISQSAVPSSIDLSSIRSPMLAQEMELRKSAEPPSPALSIRTDCSFAQARPRRPSSVMSVTPSLLFPPGATEEGDQVSPGERDGDQFLFPVSFAEAGAAAPSLPRSKTTSQMATCLGGPRPRLASTDSSRPRVASMYSTPSTGEVSFSSSAHSALFSTSSTAADSLHSFDTSEDSLQPATRRRTSSNASLSSRTRGMAHMISKTSPSISETPERAPLLDNDQGKGADGLGEVAVGSVSSGAGERKASDTLRRLKGQRSNSKLHGRFASDGKAFGVSEAVPAVPSWAKTPAASLLQPSTFKTTISTGPVAGKSEPVKGAPQTKTAPSKQPLTAAQSLERSRMAFSSIPSVIEKSESDKVTTAGPSFTSALIAGALSGLTVDLLFYPIDTIKTRLQSSQGFLAAGGFKGVYRGLGSTAVGSAPGASVFFTTYESMKPTLKRLAPAVFGEHGSLGPAGLHMASASLAEMAACLIRVPTEVVKSRQQTSSYGAKTTTSQAFKMVFKESGMRGYYRGFAGTVGREIPFTCIQFPLYERLKLEMSRSSLLGHDADSGVSNEQRVRDLPTWQAGMAGSIAGAIAAGLTTPLDVVKTRIMLHRNKDAMSQSLPKGVNTRILPTLSHIFRTEGVKVLFSGFLPRTMWIGLGGAVFLGTFDAGVKVLEP